MLNVVCHGLILPYVDLTLLSCNAATAIIVNIILSIHILNEKFIPKYDLTAMMLIIGGSMTIVCLSHTEQVTFTPEEIKSMLLQAKSICYIAFALILIVGEKKMMQYFLEHLRDFESDCVNFRSS